MKTIVKYEGQKNTIQGECKPREAMEILGLNPKEWKVTAKDVTDKTATYTIERIRSLALVPRQSDQIPEQTQESPEPLSTPDLLTGTPGKEPHPTITPAEINVYREDLQAVLKVICDVTAKKGLMPVLSMVKVEVAEETLTVTATDLEVSYTATIPAISTNTTSFLVSADTFSKEVRALGDTVEDVFVKVMADSIQINGRCVLPASVTDDFPEIEPLPEGSFTVSIPNLASALKCVLPAVSTDETRYLLTGVCFDLASGFIVATDGFRLHKAAVDTCKCPSFILLKRAAGLLAKYGADGITFAQNKASATLVGGTFITRLIEGQYPDFHSVWPDISTYEKVHFKAKDFLELIPGVLPVSNSFEIEMTINGRIDIKAESDSGTYNWHVEADSTLDGVPKVMSINSKFLVDAIKSYGDSEKIDMSFPRDYGAIIVNEQALIMPIRH